MTWFGAIKRAGAACFSAFFFCRRSIACAIRFPLAAVIYVGFPCVQGKWLRVGHSLCFAIFFIDWLCYPFRIA